MTDASSHDPTRAVTDYFRENIDRFALGSTIHVASKLNWGGFVNRHFEVGDTDRHAFYHVKLSCNGDDLSGLRRWQALTAELEARYHAPRVVGWIDVEAASLSGLVLEHVPGEPMGPDSSEMLTEIVALVERLHADEDLGCALRGRGVSSDARESVLGHYIEHLEADLAESGSLYPVSRDVLDWMRRELSKLRRLIESEPAFSEVRAVPIHGDLWADNVLVERAGAAWHLVDWDDLSLGDPVVDYATLLWPLARDGGDPTRWLGPRARDPVFIARFRLCLRAALLDEVIDPLADWVEAEQMPEHIERVRNVKLRVHERAHDLYRRKYGGR